MDKYSKQVNEEAWLICPNWTEVRRLNETPTTCTAILNTIDSRSNIEG